MGKQSRIKKNGKTGENRGKQGNSGEKKGKKEILKSIMYSGYIIESSVMKNTDSLVV